MPAYLNEFGNGFPVTRFQGLGFGEGGDFQNNGVLQLPQGYWRKSRVLRGRIDRGLDGGVHQAFFGVGEADASSQFVGGLGSVECYKKSGLPEQLFRRILGRFDYRFVLYVTYGSYERAGLAFYLLRGSGCSVLAVVCPFASRIFLALSSVCSIFFQWLPCQ